MKIEFAIKTDVNGNIVRDNLLCGAEHIAFEDVGNNKVERVGTAGATLYKATFTNYKGEKMEDLPSIYINKEDIKRLAKAS